MSIQEEQGEQYQFDPNEISQFRLKCYTSAFCSLLSNLVGLLFILKATPKHMGTYKWFLLNILVLFIFNTIQD